MLVTVAVLSFFSLQKVARGKSENFRVLSTKSQACERLITSLDSKIEQPSKQSKDQRGEVGRKGKISPLRQTIFSTCERRKRKELFGSPLLSS